LRVIAACNRIAGRLPSPNGSAKAHGMRHSMGTTEAGTATLAAPALPDREFMETGCGTGETGLAQCGPMQRHRGLRVRPSGADRCLICRHSAARAGDGHAERVPRVRVSLDGQARG